MPACDDLSSTNHHQSHVRSIIWKGDKFFSEFICDFGRFYFDYFARWWSKLGLLGLCYELHYARIGNGSQIKTKVEMILQSANGGIQQEQHKVRFSVHAFVI